MTRIEIKRVYEPATAADGYRVLVDKLWPRGVRKEELRYDLWAKELAPSAALSKWYHGNPEANWKEFERKYRQELSKTPAVDDFLQKTEKYDTVTLLYASRNVAENHALVLRDYLRGR